MAALIMPTPFAKSFLNENFPILRLNITLMQLLRNAFFCGRTDVMQSTGKILLNFIQSCGKDASFQTLLESETNPLLPENISLKFLNQNYCEMRRSQRPMIKYHCHHN